jgi:polysaccharide deacetylase 2 family uncharacterized protein YibQ
MVKKTKSRKKKPRKKRSRKTPFFSPILKVLSGTIILIGLVFTAGLLTHHFLLRKQTIQPSIGVTKPKKPVYEIYGEDDPSHERERSIKDLKSVHPAPRVALIIDDMGYDQRIADQFMALNIVMTFSILPFSPYQNEIAEGAKQNGMEIMLHLPMEPDEYPHIQPGIGTLLMAMSPDALEKQLNQNLNAVPHIRGVNNHMGSKLTASPDRMAQIFSILKKRRLFFIDSRSTPNTVCKSSARLLKLPFGERDVFLDHTLQSESIRRQLNQLVLKAKYRGKAIGIGHPHKITLNVLRVEVPKLKGKIKFVRVSELITQSY